ncbi:LacI family DNA-binding transcriptional regulator [Actinotalea sp. Marseille-Q4924]|uniref:LacI family DNA-binding transcriptional regulator n=1 Tax=Actinotalea sp. Marseille-Q4924 TaxID=2866571 RepID=UPI001CE435D3|nr:LacI family DNA-binding transcriptional regulator [Actinotalea sp. Marseille-Q4924]
MTVDAERSRPRPVMMDVARLAGVSQKTVSRVINDAPNVRDDVRRRVTEAIEQLGYRPNAAARALVTQRTRVLGIVTPGTALYGPSAQLVGVERAAWEAGYSVVIASTVDPSAKELERAVRQLLDHGVDGLVLASPVVSPSTAGLHLSLNGVPAVCLDPFDDGACPAIMPDQRTGSRAVVEHLLGLGHETVWHVAGPTAWYSAAERLAAWREALVEAGAPVNEPLAGDWSPHSGYEAGLLLADRPDVTAVFAANDHMAMGVMRAFFERGRSIPEDVSVVGFDDVPEAEYLLVPLSTVRQDFGEIARQALSTLLAALEGGEATPGVTSVPVELVPRASSGPAPTNAR